ncbi:MAG: hypothetical protein AVDCRST_MAG50-1274 [uncultured Acidimicrobiales bacterium]|uniref:Uncharacterized protein n=1 Tax=uncultured Acidimicrobiales bacterium TaxID=310071 RepID=A0A6J4HSU5_9ACTN|nr:MAG: hypothetical protein AVDCRST_MAG50-1274 [uncultured Acidimicrobiales bacterium]
MWHFVAFRGFAVSTPQQPPPGAEETPALPPLPPLPDDRTQPIDRTQQIVGAPPGPPDPIAPSFAARWRNTIILAAVVLVGVLVAAYFVLRDEPVVLEANGARITNGDAVVGQAEGVFRQLVEADGAHPPKGAGCWFAPPAQTMAASTAPPRIACGPVRLGVSTADDKVWVTGTVSYASSAGTPPDAIGTFSKLTAIEALDAGRLTRPDGKEPPGANDLRRPDDVLRTAEGKRLMGVTEGLASAERAFVRALERAEASAPPEPACWFGVTIGAANPRASDGAVYCGPVVLASSAPGAVWPRYTFSSSTGDFFSTAQMGAVSISSVTSTQKLPPGTELHRPDGRAAPDGSDLAPPDAKAQAAGYLDVVTDIPESLVLAKPRGDGRLNIPSRSLVVDGVARVPKVGSGKTAVVAAAGEELVVARFSRTARTGSAPAGTAQVVAGTIRKPFTDWSNLPEKGLVVASVPRGTPDVALEVIFEGVPQTLSLVTGERGPDARAALYRANSSVGLGTPVSVQAALPTGAPAGVSGVVTEAKLEAWRERVGWAPAGRAFLSLTVDAWKVDRPCCAVSKVEVVQVWTVALPDGTVIESRPLAPGTTTAVTFEVPETMTTATVQLSIAVSFEQGGAPGQVAGGPVAFPVQLPS